MISAPAVVGGNSTDLSQLPVNTSSSSSAIDTPSSASEAISKTQTSSSKLEPPSDHISLPPNKKRQISLEQSFAVPTSSNAVRVVVEPPSHHHHHPMQQQQCKSTEENHHPSSSLSCSSTSSVLVSESADHENERTSKDYYFDSYSHHAIHEEMLKDEVRTRTYEMAIMQNQHLFQGKIVLDVGCGTGILSMFAAKAGARHVYAVDCSTIIEQAKQIIELNGFGDKITTIKGKIEEIDLPVPQVDIIVSEWMGYFLLYESMLDTVIFARDKWLVKDGIIFPDKAVMYLCGVEDGHVKSDRIDFWGNVYGFDFTPIKEIAVKEPVVDVVEAKAIVTESVPILHLDILTCTKEDLTFSSSFSIHARRNDYVHGLVAYFECLFTQVHKPIGFSTAPFCKYTHWKQTIFYLRDTLTMCDGEVITGDISCKPNRKNPRDLDIGINLNFRGRHSDVSRQMEYRLR